MPLATLAACVLAAGFVLGVVSRLRGPVAHSQPSSPHLFTLVIRPASRFCRKSWPWGQQWQWPC